MQDIFAKKYGYSIDFQNYKDYTFDEIISYFKTDPILSSISNDDVKSLIENANLMNSEILKDDSKKLILLCSKYGALKCFRFLRSNGAEINKFCLDASINCGNNEILNECLQYQDPNNETLKQVIKGNNLDLFISIYHKIGGDVHQIIKLAAEYINLPVFLYGIFSATNISITDAVKFGIPLLIEDIISVFPNVNLNDSRTILPLSAAAQKNCAQTALKLIELGADIDMKDNNGSPLHYAAENNSVETLEVLLNAGANKEILDNWKWTPLINAARNDNVEAAEKLAKAGANMDYQDNSGRTALMHAAMHRNAKVASKLLELGAKHEIINKSQENALMIAIRYHCNEIAEKLLQFGPNIEQKDAGGCTILTIAVKFGNTFVVDKLLEKGVNLEAIDNNGNTPLYYALRQSNGLEGKLLEHGAKMENVKQENPKPSQASDED